MSKLRQNIITGEWVVIAPERAKRPEDFATKVKTDKTDNLNKKDCPFCYGGVALKEVIADAGTNNVFVIPNQYPSFAKVDRVINESDDFYFSTPSRGAHEVIIFKPHDLEISEMPESLLAEVIETYKKRIIFHGQNSEVEHSLVIHNHGENAGASVAHPHSQIMASSVIPSLIQKELVGSSDYFIKTGNCIFCEMIRQEEQEEVRIVYQNKYFVAFTAFAARFPFETWILPYEHKGAFEEIEDIEIHALADALKHVIKKLNKKVNNPDFNFWIHSLPYRSPKSQSSYHWHLEIALRIGRWGGYELGSGTVVDVISPESAAKFLNEN